VSSKGACDRSARTESERGGIPKDIVQKLRLVSARTESERGGIPQDIVPKLRFDLVGHCF
jgi:hypothetical protein